MASAGRLRDLAPRCSGADLPVLVGGTLVARAAAPGAVLVPAVLAGAVLAGAAVSGAVPVRC